MRSKFINDTELSNAGDSVEVRDAIQGTWTHLGSGPKGTP